MYESTPNPEREVRLKALSRILSRKLLPWDLGEALVEYGDASGDDVTRFERLSFGDTLLELTKMRKEKEEDMVSDPELRQLERQVLARIFNEFASRADGEIKDGENLD